MVALLIRLPDLDAAGYQSLLASTEGHGHHAPDAADVEHSHEESDEAAVEIEEPAADDHGSHEHNR